MTRIFWLMPLCLLAGCLSEQHRPGLSLPADFEQRPPPPRLPRFSGKLVDLAQSFRKLQQQCLPLPQPSDLELATAQQAVAALLRGELARAQALWAALEFDLFELVEKERRYWVAAEAYGKPVRGWGTFVIDPAGRRPLILEAPHPRHDRYTGEQAALLMQALEAHALLISTSYRCASTAPSSCSGRTGACRQIWRRGRYRRSDMAHVPRSIFHAVHQALLELQPEAVALQVHGFHRRPGRKRHLIISDGTRLPGGPDNLSNRLARQLRRQLEPKLRRAVRSCNERNNQGYLCATHNVQGRYANNSLNPCRKAARYSTNRFLHIEQSIEARRPGGSFNPELLRAALEALWPLEGENPEGPEAWISSTDGYPLPTTEPPYGLSPWAPGQPPPPPRALPAADLVSVTRSPGAVRPRLVNWDKQATREQWN